MALVKVWNDNTFENVEKFKGKTISIPPKSYIEMDKGDADLFIGQYKPITVDHDGKPTPQGFKMIRIEEIESEPEDMIETFTCMVDGKTFDTQEQLNAHVKKNYTHLLVTDTEAEAELKKRGRAKKSA